MLFQPNLQFMQSNVSEGRSDEKPPSEETGSPFYDKDSPNSGPKNRTRKKTNTHTESIWNLDAAKGQRIIEENDEADLLEEVSPNENPRKPKNKKSPTADNWQGIANNDSNISSSLQNDKVKRESFALGNKDPHKFESRITYNKRMPEVDRGGRNRSDEDDDSQGSWDFNS